MRCDVRAAVLQSAWHLAFNRAITERQALHRGWEGTCVRGLPWSAEKARRLSIHKSIELSMTQGSATVRAAASSICAQVAGALKSMGTSSVSTKYTPILGPVEVK